MIGVILRPSESAIAEEFFQLFKTPWEVYEEGKSYDVVIATADLLPRVDPGLLVLYGSERRGSDARDGIAVLDRTPGAVLDCTGTELPIYGHLLTFGSSPSLAPVATAEARLAGFRLDKAGARILRLGYDLFREVELLLSSGQPAERSLVPALDNHIKVLRGAILGAGIPLLEIPPMPSGHSFLICLTHDIDFVGIRNHRFDHTMWGFLYRSTLGGLVDFVRGRISGARLLRMWRAAASLPLVHAGFAEDFWLPFPWYLRVEKGLPATYFLVPFKNRPGEKLAVKNPERRATKYDIADIPEWTAILKSEGCEIGVHGIDSWHSIESAGVELKRVAAISGATDVGIRMHWLMQDEITFRVLDDAGYAYDSTAGYNETIGYRCGTMQVFRPPGTKRLLELPLHIQDGALFFKQQLGLAEPEAWTACTAMIERARALGGVLTILWHDRSHGPERFWGEFYMRLLDELRGSGGWFGSASQVVAWFRKRREVRFVETGLADGGTRIGLSCGGAGLSPPLTIRAHRARAISGVAQVTDIAWSGEGQIEFMIRSGDIVAGR